MSSWIWALVLVAAAWLAHWGAEHLAHPLKKLRKRWGFSVAAGGSIIGVAAASPEIGINVTSAARGVGDIGLGANLGSNIIAIPMMVMVAYIATRKKHLGKQHEQHEEHLEQHLLRVKKQAVTVQALPYLGIIAVLAVLTLPKAWRGLQLVDGFILLGLDIVYLVQALLRGRKEGQQVEWSKKEIWLAVGGLAALIAGAYLLVRATENIVEAIGIQKIVGGLFITAPMAALPEAFATWAVARHGQVTSSVTSVIGDHAVTLTLAFIPLAIVGWPVENFRLMWVNMTFIALVPALYALFIHLGYRKKAHGFTLGEALALVGVYVAYVLVVMLWVLGK